MTSNKMVVVGIYSASILALSFGAVYAIHQYDEKMIERRAELTRTDEVIDRNKDYLDHAHRCVQVASVIDRGTENVTWLCDGRLEMSHYKEVN